MDPHGTQQCPRNNGNSELHPANVLCRRRRQSYRPEMLWPSFSRIYKLWSTATAWRRAKGYRTLLCRIIRPIRPQITEKTIPFSEEKMLFHHDNATAHTGYLHIVWIMLRTAASSTVFFRFGLVRPPFVSWLEKVTRWVEICVEWGGYRRHEGLLWGPAENVCLRWVKEVGTSLCQVYQAKSRLCWKINRNFS